MTRQPDIKNKTNRLVYIPSSVEEFKLASDVKALCIQDGITIRDFLSECIDLGFKVHRWPPGNPQLTLTNYHVNPTVVAFKCGFAGCKNKAVGEGIYLPQNRKMGLCRLHLQSTANTPKVWQILAANSSGKGDN